MTKRCAPCLGAEVKTAIREAINTRDMAILLETIDDCDHDQAIELCGSKKRAASPYNLFVKECMKSRPKDKPVTEHMKVCAVEYRRKKGQGNESVSQAQADSG